ncbi:M20 family metallo-hydrolase [Virgibacillus siamensis]|uniref:M20 family metallo-hydrolase n=1 Tax=Virgibacillus siamensis TaxID=480071 RepID=UPI001C37674D|nr:M20 family metallo-hydrolase [Virgibacillus siamensis]
MVNDLCAELLKSYDDGNDGNGIYGERLANRLHEIAKIGLTKDNGSNRPGFSKGEKRAKDLVAGWMREAGLDVHTDGAGNVFGRLEGKHSNVPAILSGSHVDSVPNGGHFDGPLGVLAALEVAEAWRETGYHPNKPFEVVIFSDEEGSRFSGGLNGSEAMMGKGNLEEKKKFHDQNGWSFSEVLEDIDLSVDSYSNAKRNPTDIEMFIEVHIEQGKRLEKKGLPCGIVTGIAGPCWLELTFEGKAGHAGNTPMNDRHDALVAASEFIVEVNKLPATISDSAVATVGKQFVEPNGVNVIPGKVTLYVDIRDIHTETRDRLVNETLKIATSIAKTYEVALDTQEKTRVAPVPVKKTIQKDLERAFEGNNMECFKLPSGAGHDAMIVGTELPIAMLFVQSKDGISHNPAEWSELNDCVKAIQVLKTFIEDLQG